MVTRENLLPPILLWWRCLKRVCWCCSIKWLALMWVPQGANTNGSLLVMKNHMGSLHKFIIRRNNGKYDPIGCGIVSNQEWPVTQVVSKYISGTGHYQKVLVLNSALLGPRALQRDIRRFCAWATHKIINITWSVNRNLHFKGCKWFYTFWRNPHLVSGDDKLDVEG